MILSDFLIKKAFMLRKNREASENFEKTRSEIEEQVVPIIRKHGLESLSDLKEFLYGRSAIDIAGECHLRSVNAARALVRCGFKGEKNRIDGRDYFIISLHEEEKNE